MKNRNVNMLSGSITKGLLALTMPIMVMNVVQNIFNIVDMTVLGNWVGDGAVGAVGASGMLITLCTCLLIGIATGSNIVVAKRMGEQNNERMEKAVGTSMIVAIIGGILLSVIGLILAETFLKWTNCPDALLADATLYFRLYFVGVPFQLLYNFSAAILRAIGDTKRPMYFLLGSSGLKVLLNILFIRAFHMDVDGVGCATILANILVSTLGIIALRRSILQFRFRKMRFDIAEFKAILHLGIPTGLQSACYALANVVIGTAVNGFGPDATTGVSIANQIDNILYNISYAPALAASPYIAQNIGAHNIPRAKKSLVRSIGIAVAFGGVLGALASIFSGELASLMSSSPTVIAFARQKTMLISATYFICGINEVMSGAMRGLGKPVIPTISTFVFMCLLRFVWVYAIFPLVPDLTFLYLVWPIGWVLSILFLSAFYFPTVSKLQKKFATA